MAPAKPVRGTFLTLSPAIQALPKWPFGDSHELQERLAALIVAGVKKATCSAKAQNLWSEPGERGLVVINDDHPVAVIEIETATHTRYCDVTAEQAALEGEGDLSLAFWRDAHKAYFSRVADFSSDMEVVFETFRLVEILDADFAETAQYHVALERAETVVGA
ncbi:MAG: ASCH domain-containing protein [Ponticaulis sp.]|nr:ASCH domain-containing protein [Ponticaulis sp.]